VNTRRIARWAAENPAVALTLSGLVTFGYLRLAYLFFYNPLDVSPDEVGLGYQETLVGAVTLLLSLFVFSVGFVVAGVALGLVRAGISALDRVGARPREEASVEQGTEEAAQHEEPADARAKVRATARRAVDGIGASLIAILLVQLWLVYDEGHAARAGKESAIRVLGIRLLQSRADFVSVTPAITGSLPSAVSQRSCLLYLGQDAGTTVLYDATKRQAIRVPTAGVAVTTHKHRPKRCAHAPRRTPKPPRLEPGEGKNNP
jgi:hypothetical protein